MPAVYDVVNNIITVTGTAANDAIYVNWPGAQTVLVKVNGVIEDVTDPGINANTLVQIHGLAGSDNIQMVGTLASVIHGGDGNDVITGGSARDIIFGGAGDDNIQGGAGDDVLVGGAGRDRLSGGSGLDIEVGGEFSDPIWDATHLTTVSENWVAGTPDADLASGWVDDVVDTEVDRLTAGTEADWFLVNATDLVTDYQSGTDLKTGPNGTL